ncbi:MAG TPA: hypothetical protein PLN34_02490 [Alloprevotella sp.]|nr:hypothetical protein [Alloprevotella sp.]
MGLNDVVETVVTQTKFLTKAFPARLPEFAAADARILQTNGFNEFHNKKIPERALP